VWSHINYLRMNEFDYLHAAVQQASLCPHRQQCQLRRSTARGFNHVTVSFWQLNYLTELRDSTCSTVHADVFCGK